MTEVGGAGPGVSTPPGRRRPRRSLQLVGQFSALRLFIAAQSVEGLDDDPSERDRLLNAASTLIAHRLADPDPIVTRAGTTQRPERSHQLDDTGPTGAGSLRIQDTYRVDPNDLRS
ncbi:MAG: hypothetical protein M3357_03050, partial [Actinomycetota bacterium]|nr:hypothetical protein [Actinomycetota bacterium]